MTTVDPFAALKASQKETWATFAPMETNTLVPAHNLIRFANITDKQKVLDVACGTGVVAFAAAAKGASVSGCDLAPALIKRAREHAALAQCEVDFIEADVENLPYADETFDAVLSQYGHIFAPRPDVSLREMFRVLKPGGTLAFSSWPPEHLVGRMFALMADYFPAPEGASPPTCWGDVQVVRERLKTFEADAIFDRGLMNVPSLSISHYIALLEQTIAPLVKLQKEGSIDAINEVRARLAHLAQEYFYDGVVHCHYLMTKAKKPAR